MSHVDPLDVHMDADTKALFRRVVKVMEQNKELRHELASVQRSIDNLTKDRGELEKKLEAAVGAKDKMNELVTAMTTRNKALRDDAKQQSEDEKVRREELSEKLNKSIAEITTRMERDAHERNSIIEENDKLKLGLRAHEQEIEAFAQLYEHEFSARDTETRMLQLKLSILMERHQKDQEILPALQSAFLSASEIDKELREKVKEYSDKFELIQKTLTESNASFHKNKADIERMSKRYKAIDGERAEAVIKLEKSLMLLNKAQAEKNEIEEKIRVTEEQSKKLDALCDILNKELAK